MNGLLEHQPDWVFKRWPEYENKTTLEIFLPMRHLKYHAPFADFESAKVSTVTFYRANKCWVHYRWKNFQHFSKDIMVF